MQKAASAPAQRREQPPPATTPSTPRRWWVALYCTTVALVVVTAPTLHDEVDRRLQDSGELARVGDDGMANLAVNVGMLLAVLLFMLVLALYLSLASVLDRQIFRPRLDIAGRGPFGMFFLVAAACTVPVHAVSAACSIAAPKSSPLFYAYVLAVGLAAPLLFRRHWRVVPRGKQATLFGASLLFALGSYAA